MLNGGFGADSIRGGPGEDTVDYSDRTSAVSVALGVFAASGNADDGPVGARDTIDSDVEDILGGAGDDTLTGSPADNVIDGGPGADTIVGGAGDDGVDYSTRSEDLTIRLDGTPNSGGSLDGPPGARDTIAPDVEDIYAGSGNDTLIGNAASNFLNGGFGADHLVGGGGEDIASYAFRTAPVTVALDDTANSGNADDGPPGARDQIATDVEDIFGGAGNDSLSGNASSNFLYGGAGDDTISSRDNSTDVDVCGDGVDSVIADAADTVANDCEHIDRPTAKSNQTITFAPLPAKTYGDPDFTVSATASSGLAVSFSASGNCTLGGVTVHLTGAGSCTLTASQTGDTNYNPAPDATQTLAIAKAGQTITFGPLANKTLGATDFSVVATTSSGLAVVFAATGNCTVTGATVHLTGAGSCTITASQPGDANYNAATSITQEFTITKPAPKCTVPKVVGKTLAAAKAALTRSHCAPGKVAYAYSKATKKSRISAQSRRAGQVLPARTKVNLVVSRGRRH